MLMLNLQKQKRWEDPDYIKWVCEQVCSCCQEPGTEYDPMDPHHLIGIGGISMGMGTKAPDQWAMPLKRSCHIRWHQKPNYEIQYEWVARTLAKAVEEGVLTV